MDNVNISVMKADKCKFLFLMDKNKRHQKHLQLLHHNKTQIKTERTTKFQKEIQQEIQQCK